MKKYGQTMMNIPIQYKNTLHRSFLLNYLRSYSHVVEKTEAHVLIRFGVMPWWPHYGKGVLDNSLSHCHTTFNDASATHFCSQDRQGMYIERYSFIIAL